MLNSFTGPIVIILALVPSHYVTSYAKADSVAKSLASLKWVSIFVSAFVLGFLLVADTIVLALNWDSWDNWDIFTK